MALLAEENDFVALPMNDQALGRGSVHRALHVSAATQLTGASEISDVDVVYPGYEHRSEGHRSAPQPTSADEKWLYDRTGPRR